MKFEDLFREPSGDLGRQKTQRIGGYLLGETLGEGSFAKVKLGTHGLSKQKVAIKIIRKRFLSQGEHVQKNARRESAILKRLNHPNVADLLEVLETETAHYLVLELASGGDLIKYLSKRGRLEEDEARIYFRQIVSAVDYIHRSGIIHRDLKIGNLLIDGDKNIKIIDFGLCGEWDGQTQLVTQCGSPAFAAPEIFNKTPYGPCVDVWTIGVDLFTMVTGKLPYRIERPTNLTKLHAAIIRGYKTPDYLSQSCKDLLSRLLEPITLKRISVRDVMLHPWVNEGYAALGQWSSQPRVSAERIDMCVLRYMVGTLGVAEVTIKEALLHNRINSLTATYRLLLARMDSGLGLPPRDALLHSFAEQTVDNGIGSANDTTLESSGIRVEIRKLSGSTDKNSSIGPDDDVIAKNATLSVVTDGDTSNAPKRRSSHREMSQTPSLPDSINKSMFEYKEMIQKLKNHREAIASLRTQQSRQQPCEHRGSHVNDVITPASRNSDANHGKSVTFGDYKNQRHNNSARVLVKYASSSEDPYASLDISPLSKTNDKKRSECNTAPASISCIFCATSSSHRNGNQDLFTSPPAPPNSALGGRSHVTTTKTSTPRTSPDDATGSRQTPPKQCTLASLPSPRSLNTSQRLTKGNDVFYDGYRFKVRSADGERSLSWDLKPLKLPHGANGFHGRSRSSKSTRTWSFEKPDESHKSALNMGRVCKLRKDQYYVGNEVKHEGGAELSRLGVSYTLPDYNINMFRNRPRKQAIIVPSVSRASSVVSRDTKRVM